MEFKLSERKTDIMCKCGKEECECSDFDLSEEIITNESAVGGEYYTLNIEQVKEFIRIEGFLLEDYWRKKITFHELILRRNKLAGDKLK